VWVYFFFFSFFLKKESRKRSKKRKKNKVKYGFSLSLLWCAGDFSPSFRLHRPFNTAFPYGKAD